MGLREYLAITGETQEAFAKKVGVSRVTINSYLNKGVMPYLKHCLIIEKLTKGQVTYKDFLENHLMFKTRLPFEKYSMVNLKISR
jgi:DNA-binding XRE family transcriptional regulator